MVERVSPLLVSLCLLLPEAQLLFQGCKLVRRWLNHDCCLESVWFKTDKSQVKRNNNNENTPFGSELYDDTFELVAIYVLATAKQVS